MNKKDENYWMAYAVGWIISFLIIILWQIL